MDRWTKALLPFSVKGNDLNSVLPRLEKVNLFNTVNNKQLTEFISYHATGCMQEVYQSD